MSEEERAEKRRAVQLAYLASKELSDLQCLKLGGMSTAFRKIAKR